MANHEQDWKNRIQEQILRMEKHLASLGYEVSEIASRLPPRTTLDPRTEELLKSVEQTVKEAKPAVTEALAQGFATPYEPLQSQINEIDEGMRVLQNRSDMATVNMTKMITDMNKRLMVMEKGPNPQFLEDMALRLVRLEDRDQTKDRDINKLFDICKRNENWTDSDAVDNVEKRLDALVKAVEGFAQDGVDRSARIDEMSVDLNAMAGNTGYNTFRNDGRKNSEFGVSISERYREDQASCTKELRDLVDETAVGGSQEVHTEAEKLLIEANGELRSALTIAIREGRVTNWEIYRKRLRDILEREHAYLYPPNVDNVPSKTLYPPHWISQEGMELARTFAVGMQQYTTLALKPGAIWLILLPKENNMSEKKEVQPTSEATPELPRYKSHKIVQALAIKSLTENHNGSIDLFFRDKNYAPINLEGDEAARVNATDEADTGYLVVYEDGYRSWSPTKAFEEGYTELHLTAVEDGGGTVGGMLSLKNIARVCHEANRAYCEALGDNSQLAWEDAPDWQRDSLIDGVQFHIDNPDAGVAASHENWMRDKMADGWTFGHTKNERIKSHPCLLSFVDLPVDQQAKDYIFRAIVHAMT